MNYEIPIEEEITIILKNVRENLLTGYLAKRLSEIVKKYNESGYIDYDNMQALRKIKTASDLAKRKRCSLQLGDTTLRGIDTKLGIFYNEIRPRK